MVKTHLEEVNDFFTKHYKQVYKLVKPINSVELDTQTVNKKQGNTSKQHVIISNAFSDLESVDPDGKQPETIRVEHDNFKPTDDAHASLAKRNGKALEVAVKESLRVGRTQFTITDDTGIAKAKRNGIDLTVLWRVGSVFT